MGQTSLHPNIVVQTEQIALFFPLLSKGIQICCTKEMSLFDFLRSVLELDGEYIENTLQTIFLNGKAVDDLDRTAIDAGMTLALSGAMPGLVGATFRRSGCYSTMRQPVSHKTGEKPHADGSGRITLKLFNLIAAEIGPELLLTGVFVRSPDLAMVINKQWPYLRQGSCCILVQEEKASQEDLMSILLREKTVFLKVLPDTANP